MSVRELSHTVEYSCEGCEAKEVLEIAAASPEALKKSIETQSKYYTIKRVIPFQGQYTELKVMACCLACIPAASLKLESTIAQVIAEEAAADQQADVGINLADLQANKTVVN